MAAGIYLMLMWGYVVLPSGQWFAAYLAIMMGIMLIFWVNEAVLDVQNTSNDIRSDAEERIPTVQSVTDEPSLDASYLRLDSLKTELKAQYAQFGREQSLMNGKSLGYWQGNNNPRMR